MSAKTAATTQGAFASAIERRDVTFGPLFTSAWLLSAKLTPPATAGSPDAIAL